MRRPVRVLHASRSVHTAPDHVSSPSSYAFFLHLLLLLLLAPFILPFLSWIQDSSFVHNDHSSSFPFGFPLSSPLPLLFPLSPFFRIILSLLGSVIAVLSLFYIYIYRESHAYQYLTWNEKFIRFLRSSFRSFILFIIHEHGFSFQASRARHDKKWTGAESHLCDCSNFRKDVTERGPRPCHFLPAYF